MENLKTIKVEVIDSFFFRDQLNPGLFLFLKDFLSEVYVKIIFLPERDRLFR